MADLNDFVVTSGGRFRPRILRAGYQWESESISGGVLAIDTSGLIRVNAQTGTSDDLDSITGGVDAEVIVLQAITTHTITVKHGTGNITLLGGADIALTPSDLLFLFYDVNNAEWVEISNTVSSGGGGGGYPTWSGVELVMGGNPFSSSSFASPNPITFSAGQYDTDSYFDSGNPTYVTIPSDGYYQASAYIRQLTAPTTPSGAIMHLEIVNHSLGTYGGSRYAANSTEHNTRFRGVEVNMRPQYFSSGNEVAVTLYNSVGVSIGTSRFALWKVGE